MNEREAFEAWLLGSYGKVYSKEDCDRFVEHGHVSWLSWLARAAVEADRAQRVPDGWKQEAAEAIDWLLNNIRRDAPQLSGKAMGNAVRVRDALLASTPAPAQQEPGTPMDAHRAAYFMRRFLHEEKMLGPNEQAALHFTIDALEAMESAAQHQEPPQQERGPMTREQVRGLMETVGYEAATPQEKADFINGIRHAERHHGIRKD